MTEQPHLHYDKWNEVVASTHTRMCDHPVHGEYAIKITVIESVWDSFCYCFVLHSGLLVFSGTRWYRANDYRLWEQQANFTPELLTLTNTMSAEEAAHFPSFFNALSTGSMHGMLEEFPGMMLDGSDTVVELFRDSELVRKFEWGPAYQTRGALKQLEQLIERSRTYFPDK